jgi:hypothetical protein
MYLLCEIFYKWNKFDWTAASDQWCNVMVSMLNLSEWKETKSRFIMYKCNKKADSQKIRNKCIYVQVQVYHDQYFTMYRFKYTMASTSLFTGSSIPWPVLHYVQVQVYHGQYFTTCMYRWYYFCICSELWLVELLVWHLYTGTCIQHILQSLFYPQRGWRHRTQW